jgi:transcriptional regulator with XRE-family HTH domain
MNLGDRIRQIRFQQGLQIWELSQRTGLDQQTLSEAEQGARTLTYVEIQAIANALGVHIDVFFQNEAPAEGESVMIPVDTLTALLEEMKNK